MSPREGKRDWKPTDEQLGWCQTAGLKVAAGPLLRLDDRGVPDWMYLWEGDDDNLVRLLLDHVKAVVSRYPGRVHLWHVASRVNNGQLLSLERGEPAESGRPSGAGGAEDRSADADRRVVRPAVGEYLVDQEHDLAPLHYADALLRADLGISGFGLEINAGYWPRGSSHRPTFEYGKLIDMWSQLGLPLMVLLTAPSGDLPDPLAAKTIAAELIESPEMPQQDSQLVLASTRGAAPC